MRSLAKHAEGLAAGSLSMSRCHLQLPEPWELGRLLLLSLWPLSLKFRFRKRVAWGEGLCEGRRGGHTGV